jgi:hypothetical protein
MGYRSVTETMGLPLKYGCWFFDAGLYHALETVLHVVAVAGIEVEDYAAFNMLASWGDEVERKLYTYSLYTWPLSPMQRQCRNDEPRPSLPLGSTMSPWDV